MFSFHRQRSRIETYKPITITPSVESEQAESSHLHSTPSTPLSTINILLVGQIYEETIFYIDKYPNEGEQISARNRIQRQGGSICNMAQVLSQFPRLDPYVMSCLGNKADSSKLVSSLEKRGINISTCTYRKSPLASTSIIYNDDHKSRTVISYNDPIDLTVDEFIQNFNNRTNGNMMVDKQPPYSWVHFECKVTRNVLDQIDWLETKATLEGWRSQLTISIDFVNPDLPDIDLLLPKADVLFFLKSFAQSRHFYHPKDFLRSIYSQCKCGSLLFCNWGEGGATCLLSAEELIHASAIPVRDVIDPSGANDTFIAGIIFCLNRNLHALTALKFSCEMANRKTSKIGFDGLAEMMCKLWKASLDLATHGSSSSAHSVTSSLVTLDNERPII
ncbi:Ribokinase-like protein [Chlamydoabsidia padenii]|nr:Ribokinase-like protein [Chlamydoabsidia padenii]